MKKFKNIFLVTLLIDLLTAITLVLFLFNPEVMEEAVYSQFEGINQAGKDALYLIHIVFACIIISMIIATAVAMKINGLQRDLCDQIYEDSSISIITIKKIKKN